VEWWSCDAVAVNGAAVKVWSRIDGCGWKADGDGGGWRRRLVSNKQVEARNGPIDLQGDRRTTKRAQKAVSGALFNYS
jgi:hypothetical protein